MIRKLVLRRVTGAARSLLTVAVEVLLDVALLKSKRSIESAFTAGRMKGPTKFSSYM